MRQLSVRFGPKRSDLQGVWGKAFPPQPPAGGFGGQKKVVYATNAPCHTRYRGFPETRSLSPRSTSCKQDTLSLGMTDLYGTWSCHSDRQALREAAL